MLDPNNPASTEKKSDTIRAELAKYRLLKKEALGINEEQPRDSKGSIKSSFVGIKSPTKPDLASQESLPAQYATYSTYTNKSKDDRQSSARKVHNLTTQSLRQHEESASTQSGGSDRNKVDTSLSQPSTAARELSNTLNYNPKAKIQSTLRSSATLPTGLKKTVPNKVIPGLSSDKKKDLTWSQIEEFVDMDIERDMLHKGPKTAKSDNKDLLRSSATFSKHSTAPLYSKENIEKRPSSSLEGSNKNAKELKTKTPNSVRYSEADEKKPKDQGSSSPEPYIVDDYKMRRTLPTSASDTRTKTQTRDSKDSKSLNQLLGRNISPRSALASIKADNESERGLREEVSKWRVFGKMMAESYDDLNRKYTSYLNEKGQDKKIIDVLKEQISTLKNLLKDSKDENVKLKEISSRNTKLNTLRSTDDDSETKEQSEFYQLSIELDNLKKENGEIMKMVEFLKDENEVMKKGIEEGNRFKDMAEKYQKLADSRFKECSALAEEIICLRTDLDRSHSNYLRIQREQSSGKKINPEAFNSGSKGSQGNEQKGVGANITGQSKYKRWNEQQQQQVSKWTEDLDEVPPLPSELSTLPSREETARIDK